MGIYENAYQQALQFVPQRYREASYELLDSTVKSAIDSFVEEKDGILFTGTAGSGKTYAAVVALGRYCAAHGKMNDYGEYVIPSKDYDSVPEILFDIKRTFNSSSQETEGGIVDTLTRREVVVLDDLGAEKGSEWALSVLYLIINCRYEAMRPTIITTNLSMAQIAESMGDRIASRIAGMCRVVKMEGKDRRLRK